MTTNTDAAPITITTDARATVGNGCSVHRATVVRTEWNGRTHDHVSVSCGAASRSGASRIRRTRDDVPITCRSC